MALKRLFQVVAKQELQAGSAAATLYDAANADFLVIDPEVIFNPEQFDRANINRASLSPFSPLAGVVTGTASFQVELSGTGSAAVPSWSLFLKACGMREVETTACTIGAIGVSGVFYNGETLSFVGSGATGKVIHDTWDGETVLLVEELTGTIAAADAITGASSGATATIAGAPSVWTYGTSWVPDSIELINVDFTTDTGVNVIGDVFIGNVSGAVGILQETPTGLLVSMRMLDGIIVDGEDLENQNTPGAELAVVKAATTVQTNVPAISLAVLEDGPAKALKGARGTFTLGGGVGEAMILGFEFLGLKNAVTDEGTVTGITYTSQVPPVMLGVTFNVWGDAAADVDAFYAPRFQSLSFDYANTTGIGRDAGEATGVYGSAHVTSRATSGSMTIDVAPEGAYAFIEAVSAGTPTHMALDIGSTDGNRFKVSCPSAVFTGESGGDTEGIATRDLPFRVGSRWPDGTDTDDSELIITYVADSTA